MHSNRLALALALCLPPALPLLVSAGPPAQDPHTDPPANCPYMCESVLLPGPADNHLVPPATCVTSGDVLSHGWRKDPLSCDTCPNTYCMAWVEVDATDPGGNYALVVNAHSWQFPLGQPANEVFRLNCADDETIEVRMRWTSTELPPEGYGTGGYAQDFQFHCLCVE